MPHDLKGTVINVGDHVTIGAKVVIVHTTEEYCNVTLETDQLMYPGNSKSTIVLNAKQVVKDK